MTTISWLIDYCSEARKKYPDLEDQINEYYELCMTEIDDGGSIPHEIQLCVNDIEELITNNQKPYN